MMSECQFKVGNGGGGRVRGMAPPWSSPGTLTGRMLAATPEADDSAKQGHFTTVNSIRRLRNFPSSVSFVAVGLESPYPLAVSADGSTP